MGTERRRVARILAVLPVAVLLALPVTADAARPWWEPLGFAGQRIDAVSVASGHVLVRIGSAEYQSADSGHSFQPVGDGRHGAASPETGPRLWEIRRGTVVTGAPGHALAPDPGAPFLGDSAHLISAPGAVPGVVVAVGSDNHVWRRNVAGQWATAFILLPAGGLSGTPEVTSLAAFAKPLSAALYMGTDGYGVLISQDGGDDWIRADAGLPEHVLALATDSTTKALYAATDSGLFVHHLRLLPAPPVYHDASLYLRWLGIAVVALLAVVAAMLGFRRALPLG